MSFSFVQTEAGYTNLWKKAKLDTTKNTQSIVSKIVANKARYQAIEAKSGVPWDFIACLHYREADLNFDAYLGNGQSIHRVTTEVPSGRGPFDSFESGAEDALRLQGFWGVKYAWTVARKLYNAEEFNGEGYEHLNVNSPYIWDWTDLYAGGLFTGDHHFDPNVRENRAGVAAILKALQEARQVHIDESVGATMADTTTQAQPTTTAATDPLATVEKVVDTVLPFVGTLFPQIAPFVPLIEAGIHLGGEIMAAGGDPEKIAAAVGSHLGQIGTVVKGLKL